MIQKRLGCARNNFIKIKKAPPGINQAGLAKGSSPEKRNQVGLGGAFRAGLEPPILLFSVGGGA